ncbi:glycosyltransferase [Alicyclobacillus tolerans]|uniref:glycosyltransferase n=1 Tax=Alicyclobacillus tolerans TaxID=90970 RepID=UPI001F317382|nr:glycosyltransferase [Alicyclobacillus tolerans]MCF8564854.1 glycosyltransferase [Alicyclobacillus tolerans]
MYIIWRSTYTLIFNSPLSLVASILLFSAELLGYVQQMIFYRLMSANKDKKRSRIDSLEYCPTVDVYVPTYSEPIEVLRRTLTACTYLDYPQEKLAIHVLDDGNRTEVQELARELGIRYIARPEHDHAKAGNLNNALQMTHGELIAIFDADMVPKSFFLRQTVGYFKKRRMSFVQTPQIFFNPDPFQHNLVSNSQVSNEQDFFMIEMQNARDQFNATMFVGSNAIFSRRALGSIGGFPTGSITEDVATSLLLHSKGYKSKFVKSVLAKGLSAESFKELVHQRDRWCRGNLQSAKRWNPLTVPGLSLMQRFIYFSGVMYWFFGIQKLIYILSPILYLDFGIQSIRTNFFILVLIWLPRYIASMLSFRVLARNRRNIYWSHIYETALTPVLAVSAVSETFGLRKRKSRIFHVTKKGIVNRRLEITWNVFIPQLFLGLFCVSGLVTQLVLVAKTHHVDNYDYINDFWDIYNLGAILLSIFTSIEQPRYRKSERFSANLPCKVQHGKEMYEGRTIDISETGIRIELPFSQIQFNQSVKIHIFGVLSSPIMAQAIVRSHENFQYSFKWLDMSQQQYKEIVQIMFNQEEDVEREYQLHPGHTFIATVMRALKLKNLRFEIFRSPSSRKRRRNRLSTNVSLKSQHQSSLDS